MRFDAKLSLRQLQKIQLFTEAVSSSGGAESVLDSTSARHKLAANILQQTAANGTEAACGPTVSWLAELHLGIEGELLLKIPSVSTWPLWQTREDVLSSFAQRRDSKEEIFWYMMTSGSHTQHVWAVQQYPANREQNLPVRYRILQSCFDQYTLSAWLEPDPDAERLIRGREVYAPKNRTLQDGGPGYWIKMQRPAQEGGYDFSSTGECIMRPRPQWPKKLREWAESSLKYTAEDAFRDLLAAASNHGQGRLLTAEEMFAEEGFLGRLASWLERAHKAATSFPVGLWTQELHDDFLKLFGFPVLDFFPGVPYIGNFSVMRKLYEAGSPDALAASALAEASARASVREHGLLVKAATVRPGCEGAAGLSKALVGLRAPEFGIDSGLGPALAEHVCRGDRKSVV